MSHSPREWIGTNGRATRDHLERQYERSEDMLRALANNSYTREKSDGALELKYQKFARLVAEHIRRLSEAPRVLCLKQFNGASIGIMHGQALEHADQIGDHSQAFVLFPLESGSTTGDGYKWGRPFVWNQSVLHEVPGSCAARNDADISSNISKLVAFLRLLRVKQESTRVFVTHFVSNGVKKKVAMSSLSECVQRLRDAGISSTEGFLGELQFQNVVSRADSNPEITLEAAYECRSAVERIKDVLNDLATPIGLVDQSIHHMRYLWYTRGIETAEPQQRAVDIARSAIAALHPLRIYYCTIGGATSQAGVCTLVEDEIHIESGHTVDVEDAQGAAVGRTADEFLDDAWRGAPPDVYLLFGTWGFILDSEVQRARCDMDRQKS